jgi:CRISP-associated protein Cas1
LPLNLVHLGLAREFVSTKIGNQATLLRRHGSAPDTAKLLRQLQRRALQASSLVDLFGIEGEAAARYFEQFETMLAPRVRTEQNLQFHTRTRRPARDPLNAALNFCYGLLLGDVIRAIAACGLDPHAGFLHSSERRSRALPGVRRDRPR